MTKKYTVNDFYEELDEYHKSFFRLTEGTPERVKSSFLEAEGVKDLKKDMGNPYFEKIDMNVRQELMVCRNYLRNAYFSVIGVHSVLSDIEMCARMMNRYPWHGTKISKGEHFDFVWSSFVNHCYIFEERTKQLGKHLNLLSKNYGGEKIKVGSWIKLIDREIGEHIAFRGAHVHEWSRNYEGYEYFKMIDTLAPFDEKYRWAQKLLYRETKNNLKNEILTTREKMLNILMGLNPDPITFVLKYCIWFDALLEKHEVQTS